MSTELNLTRWLKQEYRRRPTAERSECFRVWMRNTAKGRSLVSQREVNASHAAHNWCRRKGVKA